jgi:hypothetical protein
MGIKGGIAEISTIFYKKKFEFMLQMQKILCKMNIVKRLKLVFLDNEEGNNMSNRRSRASSIRCGIPSTG